MRSGQTFGGGGRRAGVGTEKPDRNAMASGETVARRAKDSDPFHFLLRANRIVLLAVLWAALAVCIAGALASDVADWLSAWRAVSFSMPASVDAAVGPS
jgi:hypothetical protein